MTRHSSRWSTVAALTLAASLALAGCTAGNATGDTTAPPTATTAPGTVSIDQLNELGIAAAQAGDVTQANATFRIVLELDPGNALANYNLGVLAQQSGDNATALSFYDAAIDRAPDFTSAMYNKAIIVETTDAAAAIDLYRTIIGVDDQASTSYFRLSLLLDQAGDTAAAAEARDRALELDPSLANAVPPATETPAPEE